MGSVQMNLVAVVTISLVAVTSGHLLNYQSTLEDLERKCQLPEAVRMICEPKTVSSSSWFRPVTKERIKRETTEEMELIKRSFSHTNLPLPARIQFLLKIKYAFCEEQMKKRERCLAQARKSFSNSFGK